jgi:hypothetical protein
LRAFARFAFVSCFTKADFGTLRNLDTALSNRSNSVLPGTLGAGSGFMSGHIITAFFQPVHFDIIHAMPRRFSLTAATGGTSFARYDYKWSQFGLKISTKRVAIGALKALYGVKAANAAIREAERISGKKR